MCIYTYCTQTQAGIEPGICGAETKATKNCAN